jgi:hypothetical protein
MGKNIVFLYKIARLPFRKPRNDRVVGKKEISTPPLWEARDEEEIPFLARSNFFLKLFTGKLKF